MVIAVVLNEPRTAQGVGSNPLHVQQALPIPVDDKPINDFGFVVLCVCVSMS
jgi:hypothetical protein